MSLTTKTNPNLNAWLAFAAVSIFWGTTFFAIRVGVESFPPFLMAGFRHTCAGILICAYFLLRGYKIPPLKTLKVFSISGTLMLVLGNGLISWAEMYVTSGLTALICSLTPVWIVLVNSLSGDKEKITNKVIIGFIICLTGQVLIFNDNLKDFTNPNYVLGIIFILIANIAWAVGTVYSKNHKTEVHPLFGAGLQAIFAGIILDILGTCLGEWQHLNPTASSIWALLYLIVFGSVIAYGAYMFVLKKLPTTIVSTYAYINTIVAVLLGWLWLNETLNIVVAVAVILTISGVWLINNSFKKKS